MSPEAEFISKKREYFFQFALSHREEMKQLVKGRVLGKDSAGWRNISDHSILAGAYTNKIDRLAGLAEEDIVKSTSEATTHDWDKRLDKEGFGGTETTSGGVTIIKDYNIDSEIAKEQKKTGLARVTGNDWRDFDTWGLPEKILRYVDSSIMPTPDGHADFVDWRLRLDELRKRRGEAQVREGMQLYGKPLYDKLAEIMEIIEHELYQVIIANNPALAESYPDKDKLHELISDQLNQEIEQVSL